MSGHIQKQLTRSLERILEEAHLSGELKLSGRKLKDFPKVGKTGATKYNLQDTVIAGEFFPSTLCIFISIPIFSENSRFSNADEPQGENIAQSRHAIEFVFVILLSVFVYFFYEGSFVRRLPPLCLVCIIRDVVFEELSYKLSLCGCL